MPRAAITAVALALLASCSSPPMELEARKPPVYGDRPGVTAPRHDQAFIESLIFGTAQIQSDSGVTIERRK